MYSKYQAKSMRKYDYAIDHDQIIKVICKVYPDVINHEKCHQQCKKSITATVAHHIADGITAQDPMAVDDSIPAAKNTAEETVSAADVEDIVSTHTCDRERKMRADPQKRK